MSSRRHQTRTHLPAAAGATNGLKGRRSREEQWNHIGIEAEDIKQGHTYRRRQRLHIDRREGEADKRYKCVRVEQEDDIKEVASGGGREEELTNRNIHKWTIMNTAFTGASGNWLPYCLVVSIESLSTSLAFFHLRHFDKFELRNKTCMSTHQGTSKWKLCHERAKVTTYHKDYQQVLV